MYLRVGAGGRLAADMRCRVAALIALFGLAAIPAVSGGAQPSHPSLLKVSVRPGVGSTRTAFAVSFPAAAPTGAIVPARHVYRITAADPARGQCQSSAVAQAAHGKARSLVRVVLSPSRSSGWCPGTFRGEVWDVISDPCPRGKACPAVLPPPRLLGK